METIKNNRSKTCTIEILGFRSEIKEKPHKGGNSTNLLFYWILINCSAEIWSTWEWDGTITSGLLWPTQVSSQICLWTEWNKSKRTAIISLSYTISHMPYKHCHICDPYCYQCNHEYVIIIVTTTTIMSCHGHYHIKITVMLHSSSCIISKVTVIM